RFVVVVVSLNAVALATPKETAEAGATLTVPPAKGVEIGAKRHVQLAVVEFGAHRHWRPLAVFSSTYQLRGFAPVADSTHSDEVNVSLKRLVPSVFTCVPSLHATIVHRLSA